MGTILVVFGVIALFDSMMPAWFGAVVFGPALVIAIGAALLVASVRRRDETVAATARPGTARRRTRHRHRMSHRLVRGTGRRGTTSTGTGFDADATASVDLGLPADPADRQPGTELA